MNRRHVLHLLGGTATAVGLAVMPVTTRAQSSGRQYRIGLLASGPVLADADPRVAAMIRGLAERGYRVERNLAFERRGADADMSRLPRLVAELIESKVDAILTAGYPAAAAAKQATRSVPIVVTSAGDVVETGLVASLAR